MRFALLSDIHGNPPPLEAVIADAQGRGADYWFVNPGDSVSGPLWPGEMAVPSMREDWPTLAGDQERRHLSDDVVAMSASDRFAHERLSAAQRAWLAALPMKLACAPDILPCRGAPASDTAYLPEEVGEDGAYPAPPSAAAAKARAEGRRDWAFALSTGRTR